MPDKIQNDFKSLNLKDLCFKYLGCTINGTEIEHESQILALVRIARKG